MIDSYTNDDGDEVCGECELFEDECECDYEEESTA